MIGLMTEWMRGNEIEQRAGRGDLGGTMRLGAYDACSTRKAAVAEIYGATLISERHRHRYEVNINYRDTLEAAGLRFSGMSPDGVLPEIVEMPDHPWFIGVQFHPELKSRPFDPHPLFTSFIQAAVHQSRLVCDGPYRRQLRCGGSIGIVAMSGPGDRRAGFLRRLFRRQGRVPMHPEKAAPGHPGRGLRQQPHERRRHHLGLDHVLAGIRRLRRDHAGIGRRRPAPAH